MVNYGRRVGACSLCKARKVKCDETKPQCLRCQKYGRECPGVPDTKPTTLRWRYKMADPDETRRSQSVPATSSTASAAAARELPATVKERAIAIYFENFVENNFFMSYVTPMYHNCQSPSPLAHIIAACAITAYSRMEGDHSLYSLYALKEYHDALTALRENLESPNSAKQNETIAAVLLLISWESQSGQIDKQKAVESQIGHLLGVMTLLRNRGTAQFNYPISLRLFRGTRNHVFMSLAFRPTGLHLLYAPGFDWFGDRGLAEDLETEMQSKLAEAAWNTPLLRHRVETLCMGSADGSSTTIGMAEDLLKHAETIWERLENWANQLPPEWAPSSVHYATSSLDLNDITQAQAWPGSIIIYPSLVIAFMYDNYNALRVLVAAAGLEILGWMRMMRLEFTADMVADEYRWRYRHQDAVDHICASIPFQTGQYPPDFEIPDPRPSIHAEPKTRDFLGSYLAYFPMAVALRQPYVSHEQRAWLKEQVDAIELVNGCGLSKNLYHDSPYMARRDSSILGSSSDVTPTTPTILMSELAMRPLDTGLMPFDPVLDPALDPALA